MGNYCKLLTSPSSVLFFQCYYWRSSSFRFFRPSAIETSLLQDKRKKEEATSFQEVTSSYFSKPVSPPINPSFVRTNPNSKPLTSSSKLSQKIVETSASPVKPLVKVYLHHQPLILELFITLNVFTLLSPLPSASSSEEALLFSPLRPFGSINLFY